MHYKKKIMSNRQALLVYALVGMCGGIGYYITRSLCFGGFLGDPLEILIAPICGAVGGVLPELLETIVGQNFPLFRSWPMVYCLIFAPVLTERFSMLAFVYGYLVSLLWKARMFGLPNV